MLKRDAALIFELNARCGFISCEQCKKKYNRPEFVANRCPSQEMARLHGDEIADFAERLKHGKGQLTAEIDPEEILSILEED